MDDLASQLLADLTSHHIEGVAREDPTRTPFSMPLITPVTDTLWQGGCRHGASLGGFFQHIVSLYPWERFNPGGDLMSFIELRLLDGPVVPDVTQLYFLANWINYAQHTGRVLVHCQAGLNRSGLVAGLSMVIGGMAPEDAIALLRTSRSPQVLCNQKFEQWLLQQKTGISSSPLASTTAV